MLDDDGTAGGLLLVKIDFQREAIIMLIAMFGISIIGFLVWVLMYLLT